MPVTACPGRVTHLFPAGRITADAVVLSCRTRSSFPNTREVSFQQPVELDVVHSQRAAGKQRSNTRDSQGASYQVHRNDRGGVIRIPMKPPFFAHRCRDTALCCCAADAMSGTSASKRLERFHGAFTGGFSAGFYNSVRDAAGIRARCCRALGSNVQSTLQVPRTNVRT